MIDGPLKIRNFRMLLMGETVSNIGDQFTLIALPWLVLKLTNSSLTLGIIMALAGVPRAIFMLLGGAVTDRFSPKTMMQVSNIARLLLVSLLAALTLTKLIQIWMLYPISFCFGLADAFFAPAQSAMVPSTVSEEHLGQANTFVHGSIQLCQFVGPAMVGVIIGMLDRGHASMTGIGVAFVIDALTFLVSLSTLALIQHVKRNESKEEPVLDAIKNGFGYVWSNIALRYTMLAVAAVNFFTVGPLLIGIPVIAKTRLSGATAYGSIMSAWGLGTLIGYILAGVIQPSKKAFSAVVFGCVAVIGLFVIAFGFLDKTLYFVAMSLLMAVFSGYVSLTFITWIQKSTTERFMGRIMSILMFFGVGLIPFSQTLAGLVIKISERAMFVVSGGLLVLVVMCVYLIPEVRTLGREDILLKGE